jgi:outer membrane protein assembly factor BamB
MSSMLRRILPVAFSVLLVGCQQEELTTATAGSGTSATGMPDGIDTTEILSVPALDSLDPAATESPTESNPTDPSSEDAVDLTGADTGAPTDSVTSGDWPMWGGDASRNMLNATTGISLDFKPAKTLEKGKNLLWIAPLGSQTYGNPVVAGGKVFVGTNNGGEYRENQKGDRGVVLCFDEKTGEMLWQLTREKLSQGRVHDWPEQGICSTPCVEDGRMYVVTNRCEVMCVDVDGFHDGENDGPYTDETNAEELDADIIWVYDMMDELGVFPHNLATSSPAIHGDLLLLLTSNGVAEEHLEVPSPRAPSFIAMNKNTGEIVWEDSSPSLDSKAPELFANILHGQWSSPSLADINGTTQAFMPGGDGVLYSFNAESGELIWWFDLNPKDSGWELGGRGTRNNIISTPVALENSVLLSVGQDPEHGEGVGHIYRIDATGTGDLSPTVADGNGGWKTNPNSGQIWHWGGIDEDGSITGEKNGLLYRRTMSTVAVSDGRVYAPDLSGFLHCLDYQTGERLWQFDCFAAVWGSPMVVDGYVFLGDEDGEVAILKAGSKLEKVKTVSFPSSIYSTPSIANGVMYVTDRSRLYAIKLK